MTHDFCTLFDRRYLTRGLALYRSLERTCPSFRLWTLCMDRETEEALARLQLPSLEIVPLSAVEAHDPALRATKPERSRVEYCWTATPAICRFVLQTADVSEVTYLDADMLFFSDPEPLFEELGDGSVLIVPHRYAPDQWAQAKAHGIYNVEWLTFRRSGSGGDALEWWHDRCIEWCYARVEDGRFGDQKYLDELPGLFPGVHILQHVGGGLAPWNVSAHRLERVDGQVTVDDVPLVFFHYHSFREFGPAVTSRVATAAGRLYAGSRPWSVDLHYPVSSIQRELIWEPYIVALAAAEDELRREAPGIVEDPPAFPARELVYGGIRLARKLMVSILRRGARLAPGALRRHRGSWRSQDVAEQMVRLTEAQLQAPETVAPYRAFLDLLPALGGVPGLPRPARFLDIGCGVGGYGDLLERYAPGRFEYVGADYSTEILSAARARAPSRRFEQRDLFDSEAVNGFDVVFASALLDILPEPARALDALLSADAGCVVIHRQRLAEGSSRVEIVPGYAGQTTYRTILSVDEFEAAVERHGREIAATVEVGDGSRSYLLVRR